MIKTHLLVNVLVAVLLQGHIEIDGICHDQYGHLYLDERRPDFINQTYHRQIDQGGYKNNCPGRGSI